MALIFSYSCPGGGRKNGDTIARPSMFQKAQVSWEEKKIPCRLSKKAESLWVKGSENFRCNICNRGKDIYSCNMRKRMVFTCTSYIQSIEIYKKSNFRMRNQNRNFTFFYQYVGLQRLLIAKLNSALSQISTEILRRAF